jgi:threonine synthase
VHLSDEEIAAAQRELGALEGVYCEAASAAGIAGVARERPGGTVVCVVTGHGLKEAGG